MVTTDPLQHHMSASGFHPFQFDQALHASAQGQHANITGSTYGTSHLSTATYTSATRLKFRFIRATPQLANTKAVTELMMKTYGPLLLNMQKPNPITWGMPHIDSRTGQRSWSIPAVVEEGFAPLFLSACTRTEHVLSQFPLPSRAFQMLRGAQTYVQPSPHWTQLLRNFRP